MEPKYEFTQACYVERKRYTAGTVVTAGDLDSGTIASGLRTGLLRKLPPLPQSPPVNPTPPPPPAKAGGKK